MGGIVSQSRRSTVNAGHNDSTSDLNGIDQYQVVNLDGAPRQMRLYQHATSSDVIILYGQQINDPDIEHIVGDDSLWHPLTLDREKQEKYFKHLKIAVSVPSSRLLPSSGISSPNLVSSPAQGNTPRKNLIPLPPSAGTPTLLAPGKRRPSHASGIAAGDKSPEFEEMVIDEDDQPARLKILTPLDAPAILHQKYDARLDVDYLETNDEDPLLRVKDRLRHIAGGTRPHSSSNPFNRSNTNEISENSESQSSMDSRGRLDASYRSADSKPTYPVMNDGCKPRIKGQYRKFIPQIYSIPSPNSQAKDGNTVNDADANIDLRYKNENDLMTADAKAEAKSVKRRSSEKPSEDISSMTTNSAIMAAGAKGVSNSGGGAPIGGSSVKLVSRCQNCQTAFYGVTSREALEEHIVHCRNLTELREKFEGFDASLKVRTQDLDNFVQNAKSHSASYVENSNSALLDDNCSIMIEVSVALIKRVNNIQFLSADLLSMIRLRLAIQNQLQLVEDNLSTGGDDFNSDPHKQDQSVYQQLLLSRSALSDALETLDEKISVMKESARFITGIQDFTIVKVIGKGGFGTVYLGKRNENGRLYAIKAVQKELIKKSKFRRQISRERAVMAKANIFPDYFVRLFCSFQNKDFLFFVMEYVPGGDCMTLLAYYKKFPEIVAQHYIAQVSLAVAHLHNFGVVHRDIKPDNIMITRRGHAKLGDFGLVSPYYWSVNNSIATSMNSTVGGRQSGISAKSRPNPNFPVGRWLDNDADDNSPVSPNTGIAYGEEDESSNSSIHYSRPKSKRRLNSRVGNYNYTCPEIVVGEEYDHTVDWWAVAVLCFHFLAGITPFEDENNNAKITMDAVFTHQAQWERLPDNVSNEAKQFMSQILSIQRLPERLGYESSQQILDHPFFYDLDWNTLYETKGPLIPHLSNSPVTENTRVSSSSSSGPNPSSSNIHNTNDYSLSNSMGGGDKQEKSVSRKTLLLTNTDIPVYTLLSKEEINKIPNFMTRDSLPMKLAGNQQTLTSSKEILEELSSSEFSNFTFYA